MPIPQAFAAKTFRLRANFQQRLLAMHSLGSLLWAVLVFGSGTAASNGTKIITRDVVIVGGGASGAHAAVRLSDMGKTVVVVEKQGQLVRRLAPPRHEALI